MPHVPQQADIRYWHAWMPLARRAAGDVERSRAMLEEAIPMFEGAGRKRRKRESEELLRLTPGSVNGSGKAVTTHETGAACCSPRFPRPRLTEPKPRSGRCGSGLR
jgi:hypothetical protein